MTLLEKKKRTFDLRKIDYLHKHLHQRSHELDNCLNYMTLIDKQIKSRKKEGAKEKWFQ